MNKGEPIKKTYIFQQRNLSITIYGKLSLCREL